MYIEKFIFIKWKSLLDVPSVSAQGKREKETQEKPKEENLKQETPTEDQKPTVVDENNNKTSGKHKEKKADTMGQYRDREDEAEQDDETRDTVPLMGEMDSQCYQVHYSQCYQVHYS